MRLMKSSQVPLILGIAIALMAVWASGAPILGTGTSVIGGWYVYHPVGDWSWYYGCTSIDQTNGCSPCNLNGTTSRYCQDAVNGYSPYTSWHCTGGFLTIISPGGSQGNVICGGDYAGCTNLVPLSGYDCTILTQTTCEASVDDCTY